jgi:hypothetical protein
MAVNHLTVADPGVFSESSTGYTSAGSTMVTISDVLGVTM